jgi:hypothetical protein
LSEQGHCPRNGRLVEWAGPDRVGEFTIGGLMRYAGDGDDGEVEPFQSSPTSGGGYAWAFQDLDLVGPLWIEKSASRLGESRVSTPR